MDPITRRAVLKAAGAAAVAGNVFNSQAHLDALAAALRVEVPGR